MVVEHCLEPALGSRVAAYAVFIGLGKFCCCLDSVVQVTYLVYETYLGCLLASPYTSLSDAVYLSGGHLAAKGNA